jgi:hypothetical protein
MQFAIDFNILGFVQFKFVYMSLCYGHGHPHHHNYVAKNLQPLKTIENN